MMEKTFAMSGGATEIVAQGCELWISRNNPICINGSDVYIAPKNVSVTLSFHTLRLCGVSVGSVAFDIAVAHSPTSGNKENLHEWWGWLSSVLEGRQKPLKPLAVLVDANARLGPSSEPATGGFCPQPQDLAGDHLVDLCMK